MSPFLNLGWKSIGDWREEAIILVCLPSARTLSLYVTKDPCLQYGHMNVVHLSHLDTISRQSNEPSTDYPDTVLTGALKRWDLDVQVQYLSSGYVGSLRAPF